MSRSNTRSGRARRARGLVTLASTTILVLVVALPIRAATLTIELPDDVIVENPGDVIVLHTETVPDAMVGQVCSVTGMNQNNESVHPGNNIEITSANIVALLGVEDFENEVTNASGVLTLAQEITVTLLLAPDGDGVYSAELSLLLDCQAATTTTESTTTTTTQPTTTGSGQVSEVIVTAPTSTTPASGSDTVMGTVITSTTVADEVEAVEILPFTGSERDGLLVLAASAIALGSILLMSTRREESE